MLQALLAERFGVRLHRETKEVGCNLLIPAKTGPKLKPSVAVRMTMQMGPTHLMMAKATAAQIAALLSSIVSRPVLINPGMRESSTSRWIRRHPLGGCSSRRSRRGVHFHRRPGQLG